MNLPSKTIKRFAAIFCCAVILCAATSCSSEDNPVKTVGSAAVTINTQSLYEEIGFYESAVSSLASNYFFIEGTLLVYDEAGMLVGKYVENANDFQPIRFNVSNLPNGIYTVVAVEHGRQEDASFWELADEESLSTVQIRRTNEYTYWTFSLGLASQQISVVGGEVEADLTPKAAGCLVEVMINRTPSFDCHLKIWGDHMPTGIRLSPQLNEDERLAYNEDNTWGSICLIAPLTTRMTFFTIGRGEQNIDVYTYDKAEEKWSPLWWGQKFNLSKDSHAMFCYDSYPQLMYKAFVGSMDQYPAWAKAHNTKGLLLEPIMDYGLNVEDFDRIVTGSQWYCGPQSPILVPFSDKWSKNYAVWPNGKLSVDCDFETEDGKNACGFLYHYSGGDIPAEQMMEEILSWGYEYKGYFFSTNGSGVKSSVYLKPNGVDEIQFWQPTDNSYWQVGFHPYDPTDFELLIPE